MVRRNFLRIAVSILSMVAMSASAQSGGRTVFDIAEIIRRAVQNNPILLQEDIKIRNAVLRLDSIKHKALLPTLNFDVQFGVTPESDQDLIKGLGPFTRFELKALQPLFTFGKVGYAKELASYGIDAARVKSVLARQKVALQSCRMFWNLRAANRGLDIARKLRKEYRKLLKDVIRDSKKKDSDITAVDMLNIKTSSFSIERQYHSSLEAVRKVSETMRVFLQMKTNAEFHTARIAFPEFDYKRYNVDRALTAAAKIRPEMKALKLTEMASRAQLNLAKSMRYPDFFIAGGAKVRWAANRTSEDDYNDKGLGAFLGLRWKLNLWQANDGVKKARLKMRSMKEQARLLRAKVELEVRTAHSRLVKEYELLRAVRKSLKNSKTWYRLAGDNWEMGIGKVGALSKRIQPTSRLKGLQSNRSSPAVKLWPV